MEKNELMEILSAPNPLSPAVIADLKEAANIYAGKPPWIDTKKGDKSTNLGIAVASKIARVVTTRSVVTVTSDKRIDDIYQQYIEPVLRQQLEKGAALGSMVMEPFYTEAKALLDENGNIVGFEGELKVGYYYPDNVIVDEWDSPIKPRRIRLFLTKRIEDFYYTLVKMQTYDETKKSVTIINRVFKNTSAPNPYTLDNLGEDMMLPEAVPVFSTIPESITFNNVEGCLLGIYITPIANNIDIYSPAGRPYTTVAMNALERVDVTAIYTDHETRLMRARLGIDATAWQSIEQAGSHGGNTGKELDENIRDLVMVMNPGDNKGLFEEFAPQMRERSYINIRQVNLQQTEDAIGFNHGTLSDPQTQARTATEVLITMAETITTKEENQKALEICIRQCCKAIQKWLYPTQEPTDIEINFEWGTYAPAAPADQLAQDLMLYRSGILPGYALNQTARNLSELEAKMLVNAARLEQGKPPLYDDDGNVISTVKELPPETVEGDLE